MRRVVLLALTSVMGASIGLIIPAAADASCAGPPSPSPYRFTGTVTAVQRNGLIADVRTDDGRNVVVWGTPRDNVDGFTSVDRHFAAGRRYEFHPINNTSPYEDNACTATKAIGRGTPSPSAGTAGDGPADGSKGAAWIVGGAVLLTVAVLLGGGWLSHRRSGPPAASTADLTATG